MTVQAHTANAPAAIKNPRAAERSRVLFDDDNEVDLFDEFQEDSTLRLLRDDRGVQPGRYDEASWW